MSETALTAVERERRAQLNRDTRSALAMGLTIDQFRRRHDDEVEAWCDFLRSEMDRLKADDPSEILPVLAAQIEERAAAQARRIAEQTARAVVNQMLRKAIAS
jgi:hypothetical protein